MEEILRIQKPIIFDESIAHYEIHAHQPFASSTFNSNDEIRIAVQHQDLCVLPSKSSLHICGRLTKIDGTTPAERTSFVNNGICHLFEEIRYEINAVEIDKCKNVGLTTLMKNYASSSLMQAPAMANAGWVLPDARFIDDNGYFDISIPLHMILGFAEDYRRIIVNAKHELILTRSHSDTNAVIQAAPAENVRAEEYKISLTKIEWLLPYVKVADSRKVHLLNLIAKDTSIPMSFRAWDLYEYPLLPRTSKHVWVVKCSTQLEKPRYIIVAFQTNRKHQLTANASEFDHCKIRDVKLFLNSQSYPYGNLNLDIDHNQFALLYDMYINFQPSYYGKDSEPWLTKDDFLHRAPLIVIDCSKQNEFLKSGPVDIRLEFEASEAFPNNTAAYCLILHDRIIEYNPLSGSSESSKRHPVLLYIHGESYDWGSGNPYDGSVLASYTNQVVVTINYRLGVLGFLNANMSPQIKARVANYGLMDQLAALHWVQENIALFGGDPGNITLMGHGTGAACVNFLAISPTVIPGLFKRAILLSGSALSSWAVVEDPVTYAVKLAKAVNCTVPNDLLKEHELIVDCLRDTRLDDLMSADVEPPTFLSAFGPSVDGVVIKPDFQKDLLSYLGPEFQGYGQLPRRSDPGTPITSNNKYDLLFGVTTSEALWRFAEHDVQSGFEGERRDRIIRTYVRNAYTYHLTEIFYTIVNEYTEWERTTQHPSNTRDGCVQALSDAQFVAPLVQTGDLFTLRHAKKPNNPHLAPIPDHEREPMPKTYFYVFDFQTKDNDYPEKMGIVQGEDLPYIFGAPLVDGFNHFRKNYTRSEIAMSESIIQAFENFVKTGNPNVLEYHGNKADGSMPLSREKNKFRSIMWEQYDPVHQKYLEITKKPTIKNHFRAHQLSVWLRLIPELHRAGMEDVEPRHNLFRSHSDPNLYDGLVRPDPLSRMGEEYRRRNFTTELPTTTDYSITTCVSVIPSTNLQNVHNASSPDTLSGLDVAGYSAYSTALSVTIAIGCSLLILNVLIFAGVYYQRDKTRLEVKSLQQQQMMNQQCGPRGFNELKQPPPPHSHFTSSGQVIVDVENEMLRRNVIKASNEGGLLQGQSTHTLPHQHHYQKQQHTQHATLPRTSVIQEMGMQSQCPPNGSIHLTVPRAPPPPRTKSPPENQPLLQSGNIINRVTQGSMTEMRV